MRKKKKPAPKRACVPSPAPSQAPAGKRVVVEFPLVEGNLPLEVPSEADLRATFGTETLAAAAGLVASAGIGLGKEGKPLRTFVMSLAAEAKPDSAIEAMLITQAGITHAAFATTMGQMNSSRSVDQHVALGRLANGFARTMTMQLEALRRMKSGPSQTVRIEHVTVNDGGQAIVGNVGRGEGGK